MVKTLCRQSEEGEKEMMEERRGGMAACMDDMTVLAKELDRIATRDVIATPEPSTTSCLSSTIPRYSGHIV
jgi:hypothetical protein